MNDYADTLRALRVTTVQELDCLLQQLQPLIPIIAVVERRVAELTNLIEQEELSMGFGSQSAGKGWLMGLSGQS